MGTIRGCSCHIAKSGWSQLLAEGRDGSAPSSGMSDPSRQAGRTSPLVWNGNPLLAMEGAALNADLDIDPR